MEMSNEANILAEKFHSYADLQLKFEAWSAKYFQPMNIRDSQYLENKKEKNGCKKVYDAETLANFEYKKTYYQIMIILY